MTWLGLQLNMMDMTMSIPQEKLEETLWLVEEWGAKCPEKLYQLRILLGKLFHIAQCRSATRLLLTTLKDWLTPGNINLSPTFPRICNGFISTQPAAMVCP